MICQDKLHSSGEGGDGRRGEDEREMKTIKKEDAFRERKRREGDGGW